MTRHKSFEEKLEIVEYYLKHGDHRRTAKQFGVHGSMLTEWTLLYQEKGPEALKVRRHHQTYSTEFKMQVVREHLETGRGYRALARKYNIASHSTLMNWHMAYTEGERLKSTFGGMRVMVKSRKTTYEERLEIARYHEGHDISITALSERFKVAYHQAYQYVKKYEAEGAYGLEDRRGRRKTEQALTEVDKLKRDLEIERRKRKKVEVENAFLKKLDELERRDR